MTVPLQPASAADLPAVVALMNAAFRGSQTERNWSVESDYITGVRTTESLLSHEIARGAQYLLAQDSETAALQGCVSLHPKSPDTWYLGSLTVSPDQQNTGFGRQLLTAAEDYAAAHGATTIEMTVVHLRETLIAWYERRGYRQTGETRPFPYGDDRYGTPTRDDLHFIVLQKHLQN